MPAGKVPAARPATYIEIGTVASETFGASVAPTIEPVAKITAEFAPVSACAAASRITLARTRVSSAPIAAEVISIIGNFCPENGGRETDRPLIQHNMRCSVYAINRRKRARAMHRCSGSRIYQREIVGRHLGDLDQRKPGTIRKLLDGLDVAHAPFGISLAQTGVEAGVAVRRVLSATPERAVQKKHATLVQCAPRTSNKPFGDLPRRDVNDVGAEDSGQLLRLTLRVRCVAPGRGRDVKPPGLADVPKPGMLPPGFDASEVIVVEIARPPRDVRKLPGEFDDVLARPASHLDRIAGFFGQVPRQPALDRLMVAVKGRRIEPPVRLPADAILAELDDKTGHNSSPEFTSLRRKPAALSCHRPYALNDYIW